MLEHASIAPKMTLMQDLLLYPAAQSPERTALMTLDENWDFGRLLHRARQYSQALDASGLANGDRVGLLMENGPQYVSAYFGTFLAGGVAVPLDYKSQSEKLAAILRDCHVRRLVIAPLQVPNVVGILEHKQHLTWIISPSELGVRSDGIKCLSVDAIEGMPINIRQDHSSPAVINYTSGSSGLPKGVTMSHRAILANTRSIVSYLELNADDRVMQILPFFYCYGASLLHTHFMVGGSVAIDNRFIYPSSVLSNMEKSGCTGFAGVPSTFHTLSTKCDLSKLRNSKLRYMTQAGGRMDPQLVDVIRSAIAPSRFFVMYGQTEASSRLTFLQPERWIDKRGSVGKPIPGVSIKIGTESGRELPCGSVGEIWAQGENLMTEYWGNADETARVLVDGWLRTGDLGRIDEEGFLFIEGRVKGIIKSRGYRISPSEVEDVLGRHPAVYEAAVMGIPDSQDGEQVSAVLSLKQGASASETELAKHCRMFLPAYKIPRRFVLVPELPKSASGKLQRESLLTLFQTVSEKFL